jgi:CubicO group peptidase (beta-lactamase class C family)
MGQTDYSSLIGELRQLIPLEMDKNLIPGLSISLIDGKDLVWTEGFGYTDLTKEHRVTPDTLFSLQSISKTFTATGFMIAVYKHLVKLDDPLKKYYPDFTINSRFGEGEANKITFRHLLSHRSGLTHNAPIGNSFSDRECTFKEHIKSISDTWLKFPVGQRYSYSNQGIDLAGYALQLLSGKLFSEYMQEELLDPIGMINSTYDQRYVSDNCLFAKGYSDEYSEPQDLIPMIPSGGLFSSAREMAKFVSFHLLGGEIDGKRFIDTSILEEMHKPQFPVKNQLTGHGLGILRGHMSDIMILHNNGSGYGYATYIIWLPEHNIGLVILTNQNNQNVHQTISYDALRKMLILKYGREHKDKSYNSVELIERPVLIIETEKLHRFEGDYRVDAGLMLIRVLGGSLYMTPPGGEPEVLITQSEIEFTTSKGELFTFKLDEKGKPLGVSVLANISGLNYYPLHLSPHDIGPEKKKWRGFTGIYSVKIFGSIIYYCVTIKAGYLYMQGEGIFREYKPNFFFTSEGEAVIFGGNSMNYANILLTKEIDPYDKLIELIEVDSKDMRLRKRSVQSLGNAYKMMGDLEKAIEVYKLNVKLHPEFIPALQSLIETYDEKGDEANSEKYRIRISELT